MPEKNILYIFIPIYVFEILISTMALILIIRKRISINNRQLQEQMILNIIFADLIFGIAHGIIFIMFEFLWIFEFKGEGVLLYDIFYKIISSIALIAAQISFYWAFWIAYAIYKNTDNQNFSIEKAYPRFLNITIAATFFITCISQLFLFQFPSEFKSSLDLFEDLFFFILLGLMIYFYVLSLIRIKKIGLPIKPILSQLWIFPSIFIICFVPEVLINAIMGINFFRVEQFQIITSNDQQEKKYLSYVNVEKYFLLLQYIIGLLDALAYRNSYVQFDQEQSYLEETQQQIILQEYQSK